MKTPGTYKEDFSQTPDDIMSQVPLSNQQYLNCLAVPSMSNSFDPSTNPSVKPSSPAYPLTQLKGKTYPPYHCPSSWPQKALVPSRPNHSIHPSQPIAPHDILVDSSMRDHAPSPSIATWSMMQSKMPLQNWISKSRLKHPHRLDHTLTTTSIQEPHMVASPWRNWNPTSLGCTASCSDLSTPLKWKRNNTTWRKIASRGWQQKGTDIPNGTRRIETPRPLWTRSSILERRGSVTGLGY